MDPELHKADVAAPYTSTAETDDESYVDDHIPAIYTSDDEHLRPQQQSDEASNLDHYVSSLSEVSSKDKLTPPNKKAKRSVLSGLVSYAIDEDDEEHTILGDKTDSDADSLPFENASQIHKQELSNAHSATTGGVFSLLDSNEPPTILSSDHRLTNVHFREQLSNTQDFSKDSESLVHSTESKDVLTLTGRLMKEVQLPPEPTGHCKMELQEKVDRAVRRMRLDISYDPNRAIQDNKAFRNPSIYEKLISFLNVNEKGTNFPAEIYNPYRWGSQSYYDELAKVQNREIDRLMKLQKEQKKNDTTTTGSQPTSNASGTQKSGTSLAPNTEKGAVGGSVVTGYTEPKKPTKWDTGVTSTNVLSEITSNDTTKSIVPPVGSLIKQK